MYWTSYCVTAQTGLVRQNTINKHRSAFLCDTDTTDITCCINNVTSTWQANITFIYWWIKWTTAFQSGPSMLSFFFVHCLLKHLKKKWETLTQDTFGGGSGGGCNCTSWKYLWLSASIADNRLLGSYVKSFCNNQCDKTDFHQWPNWGWIKYNYCIIKYRCQYRPKSSDDGVGCTTMFDYFSLCHHIQTDCGTHPASYSKSTNQHSLSKVARAWSWNVISI